jgi:UDP-N-acetylmuramate--alanine ligase
MMLLTWWWFQQLWRILCQKYKKQRGYKFPSSKEASFWPLLPGVKRRLPLAVRPGKVQRAMLFQILEFADKQPSIISGAGLVSIIKENKIGNAKVGAGEWLIIEADESDGSIVQYHPEVGLLLNVDKDHQEIAELMDIFAVFKKNTSGLFVVNQSNALAKQLSQNLLQDFSAEENSGAGYVAGNFTQEGLQIQFDINQHPFFLYTVGRHNMENALAAVAIAHQLGVSFETCADALKEYEGIYRRHQLLGVKKGVYVIDDYAHNPAKCAASIAACQPIAPKVIAWFQPHGYGPTRFLRHDFVKEIAAALRPQDEIWMSEIFYAGGTAVKDISANDLINDIKALGKNAFFVEDRANLLETLRPHLTGDCVLLLMGARDPGLEFFSKGVFEKL